MEGPRHAARIERDGTAFIFHKEIACIPTTCSLYPLPIWQERAYSCALRTCRRLCEVGEQLRVSYEPFQPAGWVWTARRRSALISPGPTAMERGGTHNQTHPIKLGAIVGLEYTRPKINQPSKVFAGISHLCLCLPVCRQVGVDSIRPEVDSNVAFYDLNWQISQTTPSQGQLHHSLPFRSRATVCPSFGFIPPSPAIYYLQLHVARVIPRACIRSNCVMGCHPSSYLHISARRICLVVHGCPAQPPALPQLYLNIEAACAHFQRLSLAKCTSFS